MDTREKDLIANTPVTYEFMFVSPIYEVNITGRTNEFDIPLKIEILKNVSESVRQPVDGMVYKYFNAWIRSDRVENASIEYIVNNSWMNDNNIYEEDIRLVGWNESWKVLDTKIIDKNNENTYFESEVGMIGHPSYFAIIGNDVVNDEETIILSGNISEKEITEDTEEVVQNEEIDDEEEIIIDVSEEDEDLETEQSPGFEPVTVILVLILLYMKRMY